MDETDELRKRLYENRAALLKKLPRAQHFFSNTPQTNPYKRIDLEILKILKQIEQNLSRK